MLQSIVIQAFSPSAQALTAVASVGRFCDIPISSISKGAQCAFDRRFSLFIELANETKQKPVKAAQKVMVDEVAHETAEAWSIQGEYLMLYGMLTLQLIYNLLVGRRLFVPRRRAM